jgi:hypothetical protein
MIAKIVILVLCLYSSTISQEFSHFLFLDLPSAVENIWLSQGELLGNGLNPQPRAKHF